MQKHKLLLMLSVNSLTYVKTGLYRPLLKYRIDFAWKCNFNIRNIKLQVLSHFLNMLREHVSTQARQARKHVSMQARQAREHAST